MRNFSLSEIQSLSFDWMREGRVAGVAAREAGFPSIVASGDLHGLGSVR